MEAVEAAEDLGWISYETDGGFGCYEGYRLTSKGWAALGIDRPNILERLLRILRKVAYPG